MKLIAIVTIATALLGHGRLGHAQLLASFAIVVAIAILVWGSRK